MSDEFARYIVPPHTPSCIADETTCTHGSQGDPAEQLTINMNVPQWRAAFDAIERAWRQLIDIIGTAADNEEQASRREALDAASDEILNVLEPLTDEGQPAPLPAEDAFLDVTLPRATWQPAFEVVTAAYEADEDNGELNDAQDAMLHVLDPELGFMLPPWGPLS